MNGSLIRKTAFERRVSGFNIPKAFKADGLLEAPGLEIGLHRNALVTGKRRGLGYAVEVYDEGLRPVGFGFSHPDLDDPGRPSHDALLRVAREAHLLDRRCLYLGILHGHFGHFLIEALARAWAILQREPGTTLLFYQQNLPAPINSYDPDAGRMPDFIQTVFDLLGLKASDVLFASGDVRVSELIVPRPLFTINRSGTEDLCRIYDHLSKAARARPSDPRTTPRKIYMTRRRLDRANGAALRKSVANEEALETLFSKFGFAIVALEGMPFLKQIQLITDATHLAGTTGSALHMFLFNNNPDLKTYAIDWRNSRTQYILDAARGHEAAHIYCFNGRDPDGRPLIDDGLVASVMHNLLDGEKGRSADRGLADESDPMFSRDALGSSQCRAEFDAFFKEGHDWMDHHISVMLQILFRTRHVMLQRRASGSPRADSSPETLGLLGEFALLRAQRHRPGDSALYLLSPRDMKPVKDLHEIERRLPLSLVVMDGFFDIENPQASVTILETLSQSPFWAPLLILPNYLVAAQRSDAARWSELLTYHGPDFFKSYGPFRMRTDVELGSHRVVSLRGSAVRSKSAPVPPRAS